MSGESAAERWLPTQSVSTIILSVISLLNAPNFSSPANVDANVSNTFYTENYSLLFLFLFYSILFYSILFYSILFYSILFYFFSLLFLIMETIFRLNGEIVPRCIRKKLND